MTGRKRLRDIDNGISDDRQTKRLLDTSFEELSEEAFRETWGEDLRSKAREERERLAIEDADA